MTVGNKFLVGVFDDDDVLLDAVAKVREAGIRIHECYTPFPVHGLGDALGYKRSKLPIAAFLFGILGTSLALLMQFYMMGID
ncbi:MAG: quinol:electron acceptor oxidoreductase subunit ActD, partial [Tunicatimonas sp.]|uniref:quinol:electron acceptor oxidoreductase subunit ActD n=1 Tax=Tunicatimonas sp. TaxID=1940096 RepID=UPI003C7600D7